MSRGEAGQNRRGIVTDGGEPDAVCPQRFIVVLQLDELRAAIWSPVGAADEDQQQSLGAAHVVHSAEAAGLIAQREFRRRLANRDTAGHVPVLHRYKPTE